MDTSVNHGSGSNSQIPAALHIEDCMSVAASDSDEECPVEIQLCDLATCSVHHVHSSLQGGELHPVVRLVWDGAETTDRERCTYTLATHFRSDDVARRFHVDFLQQLSKSRFGRIRKATRRLSEAGCLLVAVSLATDAVVVDVVHEQAPFFVAEPREATVALIFKIIKKDLIPSWATSGTEVELSLQVKDSRTELDKKLSDLEMRHQLNMKRTEDQLRMLQEAINRLPDLMKERETQIEQEEIARDLSTIAVPHLRPDILTEPGQEAFSDKLPEKLLKSPEKDSKGLSKLLEFPQVNSGSKSPITVAVVQMDSDDAQEEPNSDGSEAGSPDRALSSLKHGRSRPWESGFPLSDQEARKLFCSISGKPEVLADDLSLARDHGDSFHPHEEYNYKDNFPNLRVVACPKSTETSSAVPMQSASSDNSNRLPSGQGAQGQGRADSVLPPNSVQEAQTDRSNAAPSNAPQQPTAAATSRQSQSQHNNAVLVPQHQPTNFSRESPNISRATAVRRAPRSSFQNELQEPRINDLSTVRSNAPQPSMPSVTSAPRQSHLPGTGGVSGSQQSNFPRGSPPASNATVLRNLPRSDAQSEAQGQGMSSLRQKLRAGSSRSNSGTPWTKQHSSRQSKARMVDRLEKAMAVATVEETPSPRSNRGMDTVLCLDVSLSMQQDGAFQEMKQVAYDLIDGLEEVAAEANLEENVAVVTMGGEARILQHLTNDFNLVRQAIDSLTPHGWTPFFESLLVCLQSLNRRGKVIGIGHHHKILARVLMVTDGNPSDETTCPPMGTDPTMSDTNFRMLFVWAMPDLTSHMHQIYWVPVGKANMTMLESLEKLKVGTIVLPESRPRLPRHFLIQTLVGRMLECRGGWRGRGRRVEEQKDPDSPDLSEFEPLFMALASDLTQEDKDEAMQCLKTKFSNPEDQTLDEVESAFKRAHVDPSKPPLGTRVVRGPDWRWEDQDGGLPGTVVKHRRRDGMVEVQWDHGGREVYRYEQDGSIDVMEAPEGTPPVILGDRMICIGALVQRGPDWSSGDEDGGPGTVGVVIDCKDDGRVKVAWRKGPVKIYRFGKHDEYEVFLCDEVSVAGQSDVQASGTNVYHFPPQSLDPGVPPAKAADQVLLWQWCDDAGQWHLYDDQNQVQLDQAYQKRPSGSCLLIRESVGYRVLFTQMLERCVNDKTTRPVRRQALSREEYQHLRSLETLTSE